MDKNKVIAALKFSVELTAFLSLVGAVWGFIVKSISKAFPIKSEVFFGEDCNERAEELRKKNERNNKIQTFLFVLFVIPLYLVEVIGGYKIGMKYKKYFEV